MYTPDQFVPARKSPTRPSPTLLPGQDFEPDGLDGPGLSLSFFALSEGARPEAQRAFMRSGLAWAQKQARA